MNFSVRNSTHILVTRLKITSSFDKKLIHPKSSQYFNNFTTKLLNNF